MDTYRRESDGAILIVGCLILSLIWTWHDMVFRFLTWVVVGMLTVLLPFLFLKRRRQRHEDGLYPEKWDMMDGRAFEQQIVIWLKRTFEEVILTEYFDSGIDIIAAKDGMVFGVQVKRASKKVGVAAVRAAIAGLKHYGCTRAMVVTNSEFTKPAIRLAEENDCLLVDGESLKRDIYSVSSKAVATI